MTFAIPVARRAAGALAAASFLALATAAMAQSTVPIAVPTTQIGATTAGQVQSNGVGEAAAGVGQAPAAVLVDDQRGNGTVNQPTLLQDQRAGRRAPPFGSELFLNGNQPGQPNGQADPNYVLRPGDRIQVSSFGLVNEAQELTVDAAGNIVLPNVGPVKVAGLSAGQINTAVSQATGKVYQNTVKIYASTVSSGATDVFVTGPVSKPGVQAGSGQDSIVGFLQRAGGIDPDRGSYRHIIVRRGGRTIAQADLYAFLQSGDLPDVQLQNGDVIVVGQQGPIVSVSGAARAPFTFEFAESGMATGAELLRYARPRPEVTHVQVLGTRNGRPFNAYMTRGAFAGFPLQDGDRLGFQADAPSSTFTVSVQGANDGPSVYAVNRGDAIGPFLRQLQLSSLADRQMIHIERQSIADAQKQLLDESLARLQKAIYTSTSASPGVAQARAANAPGLERYIAQARQVQPKGLVSFPQGADLDHVLLEPDDIIVVPYVSQTVVIAGEVELPQTVLWKPGGDAKAYVTQAGGYTNHANRKDTLVIHPDGSTQRGGAVRSGDRVLVPPKLGGQPIEVIRDITQILYQLGIAGLAIAKF